MGGQRFKAHLNESRHNHGRADNVGRRGGQTHTKNDGHDHDQEQCQDQVAIRDLQDHSDQLVAQTSHRQNTDNNARTGAGRDHTQAILHAASHDLNEAADIITGTFADQRQHQAHQGADQAGTDYRVIGENQHADQGHQGDHQQAVGGKGSLQVRQLFLLHAAQASFNSLQVNTDEDRAKVHDGRDHSRLGDFHIGNTQSFRHQEGTSTHDGRHDLAARRGNRFHGTGEVLPITDFLHQRDRKGTSGNHVGRRGTGDHAHECAGNNSRLGRATAEHAQAADRRINKESAAASALQHRAKDHEQDNIGRAGTDRSTKNTIHRKEVCSNALQAIAAMAKQTGDIVAQHRIGNKHQSQDRHRGAIGSAGKLQDHEHTQDADERIHLRRREAHIHLQPGPVDDNISCHQDHDRNAEIV